MNLRETLELRYFGFRHIRMLLYARPSVIELSAARSVVQIPLRRRTRNHLHSMYFGALAIGADCAAGLLAFQHIKQQPGTIDLVFSKFSADFLKRAEAHTVFTCNEGDRIGTLVAEATRSDERVEMPFEVIATAPEQTGDEPVARFELVLSLKRRSRR